MSEEPPKLHIDSDWKAEAQAEKERLAAEADQKTAQAATPPPGELPPADFKSLMGLLASQAIMGLGAYTDPQSGGVVVDLPGAKFAIDLLGVLEEKTKGNLDDAEGEEIAKVLTELRARFVQVAQLVAQQAEAGGPAASDPNAATPPPDLRIEEP